MGDIIFTREYQEVHNYLDYKIFVDNEEVSKISNGSRKVISLKPGKYMVFVKVNGAKSQNYEVNIEEKKTVRLTCGSKLTGIKLLFSWFFAFSKNNLYLKETL